MNKLDTQYQALLKDIIDNGIVKEDRTGTGTMSVFGRQIRHKMSEGFPLLTTKKMPFKTIVGELIWFLSGSTDIRDLWKHNCKIWDGDWYKKYKTTCSSPYSLEEIKEKVKNFDRKPHGFHDSMFSLGPIYGKQWRKWGRNEYPEYDKYNRDNVGIDQIQNIIETLKTNPDSRRMMVNAWNVSELDKMTLPPCHYGFQVYTRELTMEEKTEWCKVNDNHMDCPMRAVSLMWNQRSVDTFLGLPFNIASYGLLLQMLADEVGMVPDELIGNLGDTHLYLNHIEQAKEQIGKELTLNERIEIYRRDYADGMGGELAGFINAKLTTRNIPTHTREPYALPTVVLQDGMYSNFLSDFILKDYKSHGPIKAPLSN